MKKEKAVESFELKWRKKLSELAILLYLSYNEEGAHAYELRAKVEEILFSKRKEAQKILEKLKLLLEEIIEAKVRGEINREFKEELRGYPILIRNRYIRALIEEGKTIPEQESIEYIKELISLTEKALEEIRASSLLWTNISGIYPSINSLEKAGFIHLKRTEEHEGRLRKIYVITEVGRSALQRTMTALVEVSHFMFQRGISNWFEKGRIMAPSKPPTIFGELIKKFREGLPEPVIMKKFFAPRMPFNKGILSFLLPPELSFITPILMPFMSPEQLLRLLEQIEDEVQKELVINNLKIRLKEMRNSIDSVLSALEKFGKDS